MSSVTNVILTFEVDPVQNDIGFGNGGDEEDVLTTKVIETINRSIGRLVGQFVHVNGAVDASPGKRLEHQVAVGAFNYLDMDGELFKAIREIPWDYPENVKLFVCDEQEVCFAPVDWTD